MFNKPLFKYLIIALLVVIVFFACIIYYLYARKKVIEYKFQAIMTHQFIVSDTEEIESDIDEIKNSIIKLDPDIFEICSVIKDLDSGFNYSVYNTEKMTSSISELGSHVEELKYMIKKFDPIKWSESDFENLQFKYIALSLDLTFFIGSIKTLTSNIEDLKYDIIELEPDKWSVSDIEKFESDLDNIESNLLELKANLNYTHNDILYLRDLKQITFYQFFLLQIENHYIINDKCILV